ncbi:hypothetical protein GGI03_008818, partial [Coemansia sp. RSA 2337]
TRVGTFILRAGSALLSQLDYRAPDRWWLCLCRRSKGSQTVHSPGAAITRQANEKVIWNAIDTLSRGY